MPLQINSKAVMDASFGVNKVVAMMLNGALIWQRKASRLPLGYTELEWLNTNNGYLYSGITFENGTTIEQVVKFTDSGKRDLLGWRANATWYWGSDASNRFELGGDYIIPTETANPLEWHKVAYKHEGNGKSCYIIIDDNITLERPGAGSVTSNTYDFTASYNRGSVYFKTLKKILPDGTVTNNKVPALRDSDNAVGFYDKITNEFRACENAIAGPAKYLPSTYTEVEYIRSTGTQYIRTNFYATNNSSVKIKFRRLNDDGNGIFGSRDTSTPKNAFLMWGAGAGFWRAQYGSQNFVSEIEKDAEWHVWEQRGTECFLDGKPFYTFTAETFRNTYEQILFGINSDPKTTKYLTETDIAYVQYGDSGVAYEDFKPCVRLQDNVAGFYNMITNEFVSNAGTGAFEHGPLLSIPSEYQELQYVESEGTTSDADNTHSIDLGFTGNQDTVMNCNVAMINTPRRVFGDNTTTARAITLYLAGSGTEINRFGSNQVTGAILSTLKMGEFQKYTVDKTGIYCDGKQIATYSEAEFETSGNLRFLTINGYTPNVGILRVKSFEVVDKLYFKPVRRISDSTVGFFDMYSGSFHTCDGLTAGPIKPVSC